MSAPAMVLVLALIGMEPAPVTLVGTVRDPDGKPLARATVFISTAAPRTGVGVLCPSCYPDCAKRGVTDGQGQFVLKDLDPELKFRLLAVAEGFQPAFTEKHVTPAAGAVTIALKPHDLDRRDPKRVLRGRVVDEDGKPVARAVVEPIGIHRKEFTRFGGLDEFGIDPLAVTDDDGQFRLAVGKDAEAVLLQVDAPYLARSRPKPLAAGPERHTITLGPGATVRGRVVKNGKPLAGVVLGMVQQDRNSERSVGHFEFATDHDGRFAFVNIPPDDAYFLCGQMDSLKASGGLGVRPLKTAGHGSVIDLGTMELEPAFVVSGRLVLADEKPLPSDTRVVLSSEDGWDAQIVKTALDGSFRFTGVPAGRYSLSGGPREYHLSRRNRSLDRLNGFSLVGKVEHDLAGLRVLLEAGPVERDSGPMTQEAAKDYHKRRESTLEGAPEPK